MMKKLLLLALACCSIIAPIECSKKGKSKRKNRENSTSVIKHIDKSEPLEKRLGLKDSMLKNIREFEDNHPKVLSFGVTAAGFALSAFAGIGYENLAVPKHLTLLVMLGVHAAFGYEFGALPPDAFEDQTDLGFVGCPIVLGLLTGVVGSMAVLTNLDNPILNNPALIGGTLAANNVFCWYKMYTLFNKLNPVSSDTLFEWDPVSADLWTIR